MKQFHSSPKSIILTQKIEDIFIQYNFNLCHLKFIFFLKMPVCIFMEKTMVIFFHITKNSGNEHSGITEVCCSFQMNSPHFFSLIWYTFYFPFSNIRLLSMMLFQIPHISLVIQSLPRGECIPETTINCYYIFLYMLFSWSHLNLNGNYREQY